MKSHHAILFLLFIASLFYPLQSVIFAADNDMTLYGNEAALANNIVLTIDDASIETNVRQIFSILQSHGVTATFFPNTRYITQQDAQLWRNIVSAGNEIGYHTRNHSSYLSVNELQNDFTLFQDEIRMILNNPSYTIRYVRPPNGTWNADWITWANAHHLRTVRWNITSVTDDIIYIDGVLRNRERGGSIILFHTGADDIQWLQKMLPQLAYLQFGEAGQHYRITNLTTALND